MKKPRRKHSKIAALPGAINTEVNRLLTTPGWTYEKIADHLKQLGHPVGKSSVGRYGQDFLSRLQDLKEVKEQAKAIVEETGGTGMEMEEAAAQIALQRVMEFLLNLKQADMEGEQVNKMISALARLQASGASRENVKIIKKKAEQAVKAVNAIGKQKGLTPETIKQIEEEILGLVR